MSLSLNTWTHYLDPMKAEVRVQVSWEGQPQAEVRGRILGPKCPGTTTIEVAYPLQVIDSSPEISMLKAIIPEPSVWDTATPFYYSVVIELWNGTDRVAKASATHELRRSLPSS